MAIKSGPVYNHGFSTIMDGKTSTGAGDWYEMTPSRAELNLVAKSWQAVVAGTGAVTATVEIEASNDGTQEEAIATFTLSGTTSDDDMTSLESLYRYYRANVTAISGTGAAVTVIMGY